MNKISDAVAALVRDNTFLQTGLSHKLLNLSQVARFLRPQVEARTKKKVQASAILMQLSRMSRQDNFRKVPEQIGIENINVQTELAVATYTKTAQTIEEVNQVYSLLQKNNGYITITRGANQVTLIFESKNFATVKSTITATALYLNQELAALGISFGEKQLSTPGLFYYIYQQLYFQNINVIEQASTSTELILYLAQGDLRLAFDTIYSHFVGR